MQLPGLGDKLINSDQSQPCLSSSRPPASKQLCLCSQRQGLPSTRNHDITLLISEAPKRNKKKWWLVRSLYLIVSRFTAESFHLSRELPEPLRGWDVPAPCPLSADHLDINELSLWWEEKYPSDNQSFHLVSVTGSTRCDSQSCQLDLFDFPGTYTLVFLEF